MNAGLRSHPLAALALAGAFAACIAVEAIAYRRRGRAYDWSEALTSVAVAVAQRGIGALSFASLVPLTNFAFGRRLWTFPSHGLAGAVAAFVIVEFAYYWMHRGAHRIAWMWATHSVHHSAEQLNFAAAIRLGATGIVSFEWVPYAFVIVVLGIAPSTVAGLLALDLLYQFFLHTDVLPALDARQWIFNTPSDHRVHHALNDRYLDKNFGGMLIVFDRMFGTYAAERADDPPVYGILGERRGRNPARVLFGGWIRLSTRLRASRSFGEGVRTALGPP